MITNSVANRRKERKVTQIELAKALKVTRQTIIAIENNRFNPSLELAFKICIFFNCSIEQIFTYEEVI